MEEMEVAARLAREGATVGLLEAEGLGGTGFAPVGDALIPSEMDARERGGGLDAATLGRLAGLADGGAGALGGNDALLLGA
jgi:hypothetical protein